MRVIAGRVKGHTLRAPRGLETRPTSDKVREALFAILGGIFIDRYVLDLFAGTGALGIEALSRGASGAVFVERRGPACQTIKANLEHTGLVSEAKVLCMPVERALHILNEPFSLILLDPPYAYPGLNDIMTMVCGGHLVVADTTVVLEHSPRVAVEDRFGGLSLQRRRVYGDTAISIYSVQEDQAL